MLAESLRGVVSQQLLRRTDGKGRVAAHEIEDLLSAGVSTPEEAYAKAHNEAEFLPYLKVSMNGGRPVAAPVA